MQQLEHQRRGIAVRGTLGQQRGQRAARAVARRGQPGGVDPERARVVRHPSQHDEHVVEPGRRPMFRSQPVVDRDDGALRTSCEFDALSMVDVQVAQDECTRVAVDHRGSGSWPGSVDPHPDVARRTHGHRVIDDVHAAGVQRRGGLRPALVQRFPHWADDVGRQVGSRVDERAQRGMQAPGELAVRHRAHLGQPLTAVRAGTAAAAIAAGPSKS